jgi:hypothetical protein
VNAVLIACFKKGKQYVALKIGFYRRCCLLSLTYEVGERTRCPDVQWKKAPSYDSAFIRVGVEGIVFVVSMDN